MECLTPAFSLDIFMDNYFTFERHVCSKERLRKCTIGQRVEEKIKKTNMATLNSAHQAKKQCNFDSRWLEGQQYGLRSFF